MEDAQLQRIRRRAFRLGFRVYKLNSRNKYFLYRIEKGGNLTISPRVMTLAELEKTLNDIAAEDAAD